MHTLPRLRRHLWLAVAAFMVFSACGSSEPRLSIDINRIGLDLAFVDPRTAVPRSPAAAGLGIGNVGDLLDIIEGRNPFAARPRIPTKPCPKALADDVPERSAGSSILVYPVLGTYSYHNEGTFGLRIPGIADGRVLSYPARSLLELKDLRAFTPTAAGVAALQAQAQTGQTLPTVPTVPVPVTTPTLPAYLPITGTETPDLEEDDGPYAQPFLVTAVQPGLAFDVETTYAVSRDRTAVPIETVPADLRNRVSDQVSRVYNRPGVSVQRLSVVPARGKAALLVPYPMPRLYELPLAAPRGLREIVKENTAIYDSYSAPATGQEAVDSRTKVETPAAVPRSDGYDVAEPGPAKDASEAAVAAHRAAQKGTPLEGSESDPLASSDRDVGTHGANVLAVERRVISTERVDVCGEVVDTWLVANSQTINYQDPDDPTATFTERTTTLYNVGPQYGGLIVRQRTTSITTFTVASIPVEIKVNYTSTLDSVKPVLASGK